MPPLTLRMNSYNHYKDCLRTIELNARIRKNRDNSYSNDKENNDINRKVELLIKEQA